MQNQYDTGIIGCGWLGFPLAKYWVANGLSVAGTTTHIEKLALLTDARIAAYLVQLNSANVQEHLSGFLQVKTVVVAIPPKRKQHPPVEFLREMKILAGAIETSPVTHIIFISSTSAYNNANCTVDEDSVVGENSLMVQTEQLFPAHKTAYVRFGGLMGPDRHPGRFFSSRKDSPNGQAPVNMIHLDDCIGIIDFIRQNQLTGVYNGVAPSHPQKQVFYAEAARHYNSSSSPTFVNELTEWKQVEPKNIIKKGYVFQRPDLMASLDKPIW